MKTFAFTLSFAAFMALAFSSLPAASSTEAFPKGSPKFNTSLSAALVQAKKEGKPVVAIFSAVWCGPCQMMRQEVYPSDAVKTYKDKFVWAYLDSDSPANEKDANKFGVDVIPHIQFLDSSGHSIDKQVGSSSPKEFAKKLAVVLKETDGVKKPSKK